MSEKISEAGKHYSTVLPEYFKMIGNQASVGLELPIALSPFFAIARFALKKCGLPSPEQIAEIAEENKSLLNASKDGLTDSLNLQGFNLLLNDLEKSGAFEQLNADKWSVQICLVDLDKLKQHNDLGGQTGGDDTISAFSSVIGKLFRRNGSYLDNILPDEVMQPNKSEHVSSVSDALLNKRNHDIIVRNGGDEMVIITLLPNDDKVGEREDQMQNALESEVKRVKARLDDVYVEYHSHNGRISDGSILNDGLTIDFEKTSKNFVRARLTTTFAICRINTISAESIRKTFGVLDLEIKKSKAERKTLETRGLILPESTKHIIV